MLDAEWKAQFNETCPWLPTIVNFIDIFGAKSQIYQIWKPTFLRAQEYPVMKDWLNQHKDRLSTNDLWSVEAQHTLTFADLKKWLEEKDREADIKQDVKGKRKAPQSSPKLKKKKHDDRDRGVQRKHKKSKTSMEPDRESEEVTVGMFFFLTFFFKFEISFCCVQQFQVPFQIDFTVCIVCYC
jgi:hypothetical protein